MLQRSFVLQIVKSDFIHSIQQAVDNKQNKILQGMVKMQETP